MLASTYWSFIYEFIYFYCGYLWGCRVFQPLLSLYVYVCQIYPRKTFVGNNNCSESSSIVNTDFFVGFPTKKFICLFNVVVMDSLTRLANRDD